MSLGFIGFLLIVAALVGIGMIALLVYAIYRAVKSADDSSSKDRVCNERQAASMGKGAGR